LNLKSSRFARLISQYFTEVIALFGPGEGGLRIIVDPYSKASSDRVNLIVEMHADVNLVRPEAFAIGANSAVA
jgi:hypothetical protein